MNKIVKISLSQGRFALIDEEDYGVVSRCKWYYELGYARCYIPIRKSMRMQRLIMNPNYSEKVDHINGDTLDNRRSNLRICTNAENHRNKKLAKSNRSGFKGISWCKPREKWTASIKINRRSIYLGAFECPKKAAEAYDEAAKEYHKEFARTNEMLKLI